MKLALRYLKLMAGLVVCSIGIVLTINANIGLSPWDVFHQGLGKLTGMTIGQAGILVGLLILVVDWMLGEHFGMGTVLNIIVIGMLMDFIMASGFIPIAHTMVWSVFYVLLGMFIIGCGSVLYLGAGLGAGPRDGIMVVLVKRSGKSVRLIRTLIEGSVFAAGALMGGKIGYGTAIMVAAFGFFIQLAFKMCKFDVKSVQHRSIDDEVAFFKDYLSKRKVRQN